MEGMLSDEVPRVVTPPPAEVEPTREYLVALLKQGKVEEFNRIRPRVPRSDLEVPGVDLPYKELDLSGENFAGLDLLQVDFSRVILRWVDFSGADLRGADFSFAYLQGTEFHRSKLKGARFRRAAGVRMDERYLWDELIYASRYDIVFPESTR